MSSFFRSVDDATASGAEDSSVSGDEDTAPLPESLDGIQTLSSDDIGPLVDACASSSALPSNAVAPEQPPISRDIHSDLLVHALLEEKCFREAIEHFKKQTGSQRWTAQHAEVQVKAREIYERMTRELERMNVLPAGAASQQFGSLRAKYRSGINMLFSQLANAAPPVERGGSAIPGPIQDLLSEGSTPGDLEVAMDMRKMALSDPAMVDNVIGQAAGHAMFDASRYGRDFVEMDRIGKGGYGEVFRVEHKLDGVQYAVKKIPVGASRVKKIEERGQSELDHLLNELRTLARLDHPNIARYFGGWMEFYVAPTSLPNADSPSKTRHMLLDRPRERDSKDMSDGLSARNIATSDNTSDVDVVFERSGETDVSNHEEAREDVRVRSGSPQERRRRTTMSSTISATSRRSNATRASVEDEEIETIPRDSLPTATGTDASLAPTDGADSSALLSDQSAYGQRQQRAPVLTLHLQMSLYPLTLSQYLSNDVDGARPLPSPLTMDDPLARYRGLRHCYHAVMSLLIFLALLDGVEYLHSQGLVHRDLKPANVFISVSNRPSASTHCISRDVCPSCRWPDGHGGKLYLNFRIGDFGLVTSIASAEDVPHHSTPQHPSKAVGTQHYRPPSHADIADERLDVFALGVILLELVWPFSTQMERHTALHGLKNGALPSTFDHRLGRCGGKIRDIILSMVQTGRGDENNNKTTLGQVRSAVEEVLDDAKEQ